MIRMSHPDHGFTHADGKGEVERLQKYGWSVENPDELKPKEPAAPVVAPTPVVSPTITAPRRPGRPVGS